MRPEELLNSLDHIGEDLLADAEQNILVRSRRPWIKNAVAAVLVVAIGVGSFLTLDLLRHNTPISASDPFLAASDTAPTGLEALPTESNSSYPDPEFDASLPILHMELRPIDLPARLHPISDNCPALYDPSITSLPVYRSHVIDRNEFLNPNLRQFYSEDQIRAVLDSAAEQMGIQLKETYNRELWRDDALCELSAETIFGTLDVFGDGELCAYAYRSEPSATNEDLVLLDNAQLTMSANSGLLPEVYNKMLTKLNAQIHKASQKKMISLIEKIHNVLSLPQYEHILFDVLANRAYCFPAKEDPTQQLLARSFEGYLIDTSNYTDWNFVYWYQRPGATNTSVLDQDWMELVGWYPLITLEEAKAQVLAENYIDLTRVCAESFCYEDLEDVQLVYPTPRDHGMVIPYYEFLLDDYSYVGSHHRICVPAVRPEYLENWPKYELRTTDPEPVDPSDSSAAQEQEQKLVEWEATLSSDHYRSYQLRPAELKPAGPADPTNLDGCTVFSNGQSRIWQEQDEIKKKDLRSGETQVLFTLEPHRDQNVDLVAVTNNRLYFGWADTDVWWGRNVYSVDHRNENRIDLAEIQDVHFENGYIILKSFVSDVRPVSLKLIDPNDRVILDITECFAWKMIDDTVYYVYVSALQGMDVAKMYQIRGDELFQNTQFDVCKIDAAGNITKIGSFDKDATSKYNECTFSIEADEGKISYCYRIDPRRYQRIDLPIAPEDPVGLRVHDQNGDTSEYVLSADHAAWIRDLFYDHEKEIIESPVESIGTVEFLIGDDILSTSIGGSYQMDGRIDQSLVLLKLSDEESQQLHKILGAYVTDLALIP